MATKRYRAGQVPEYARDEKPLDFAVAAKGSAAVRRPAAGASSGVDKDARLSRLERQQTAAVEDEEERLQRHRHISQAAEELNKDSEVAEERPRARRVVQEAEVLAAPDEMMAELDQRKERLRQAALQRQAEEEEGEGELPIGEDDEDGFDGSEEESDDDDDDEDDWDALAPSRPMSTPKFITKEKRDTIKEKLVEEEEEQRRLEMEAKAAAERKERTRQLLRDQIMRDQQQLDKPGDEIVEGSDDEVEGVIEDSDDETFQQREYEKWKLRELQRIRRDREERDAMKKEREEAEARRNMSDAEIAALKAKDGLLDKERKQMKFLQKYYHKGAFYQDDIKDLEKDKKVDWVAPTGEDTYVDKSALPKVLQVKNFGKKGRTKYTHLADQDTSKKDDAWGQAHAVAFSGKYPSSRGPGGPGGPPMMGAPTGANIIAKQKDRMGGFGGFERPSKKQKTDHHH